MKYRKYAETKIPNIARTEKKRFLSKCAVCDSKKSKLIKQQEDSGLLSRIEIKIPSSIIPLVDLLLF